MANSDKTTGGRADNSPNETRQNTPDTPPTNWHAACDDDEVLACPSCDTASIYHKAPGTRGGPRDRPEDWQCKDCSAHFDAPEIRRRRDLPEDKRPASLVAIAEEVFGDP